VGSGLAGRHAHAFALIRTRAALRCWPRDRAISWASLAVLRFALAMIVFATHLVFFTGYGGWTEAVASLDGKAAVIGFLLISGFSIAASSDRDRDGFYRRRFLRVYRLYCFVVLFAFGLEIWRY
jgi:peptidoglycan/LPS O-acetylase OafA/YrhL